jgi:nitronate monooxygenase
VSRTVLRTALCRRLGIEYPVMLAGMGPTVGDGPRGVAGPELVAAVCNAGGLGVLGGTGLSADQLAAEIARVRQLTDRPFGVDLLLPEPRLSAEVRRSLPEDLSQLVPEVHREAARRLKRRLGLPEVPGAQVGIDGFDPDEQVEVVVAERVAVLATGLGNPAPYSERVHEAGGLVVSLVGTPAAAREVVAGGADVVVAQGHEAGGHTGRIGTMALVPQVIDAVSPTPVVAAGGIADGRGLAAALALGCEAAWCGTVFVATEEAELDRARKQRILEAGADQTRITRLYSGKTMRNVDNELIRAWEESGMEPLPMGLQSVLAADLLASAKAAGRSDLLMNPAGQVCGMLGRIRPAAEVLHQMVAEAADILARRLPKQVEVSLGW